MKRYRGKTVVVTGGAQGIGRALVAAFAAEGARVFAWDEDEEALAELPKGVRGVRCDVGDPEDVERAARETLGKAVRLHVLVNNAGIGWPAGLFDLTVEGWDRTLNINLRAAWLCTKHLAPAMPEGGAIVNIASTRALMSEPGTEPYAASKGGLLALTHAMAITLGERRIRVNCVSPGWIEVAEYKKESERKEPGLREIDHEQHPVGRVGRPEDIAEAVVYLASDQAGFVTGANLVVDGGMTRKMIYVE